MCWRCQRDESLCLDELDNHLSSWKWFRHSKNECRQAQPSTGWACPCGGFWISAGVSVGWSGRRGESLPQFMEVLRTGWACPCGGFWISASVSVCAESVVNGWQADKRMENRESPNPLIRLISAGDLLLAAESPVISAPIPSSPVPPNSAACLCFWRVART